ncbi:MAG: hypothetical protein PHW53_02945 [Patescibacteria group bacterium]|nr:hypothetical protein [Patescibacteria group bacterium]
MEQKILAGTKLLLFAICTLIILAAAFLTGLFWGQKSAKDAFNLGYTTAWQAAKEAVDASGLFAPEPEEIMAISGTITNINASAGALTITAEPLSDNPLASRENISRIVRTDSATTFIIRTEKDTEKFDAEQEAFNKKMNALAANQTPPEPPTLYNDTPAEFEDIEQGGRITVKAETNIKDAAEFTASEVIIYQ